MLSPRYASAEFYEVNFLLFYAFTVASKFCINGGRLMFDFRLVGHFNSYPLQVSFVVIVFQCIFMC